jgi:hypothetical protein
MTYACPAWEFAAESHLLKLQRLQNKVLRTIGTSDQVKGSLKWDSKYGREFCGTSTQ